jgi:hypothetical protein
VRYLKRLATKTKVIKAGRLNSIRHFLHYFSLSTPKQRLTTWLVLTLLIYFARFSWLVNLSLYKRAGLDFMPSIGLTRSYWLLLHGKLSQALAMNRLIIVVIAVGSFLLVKDAKSLLRNRVASPSA